MKKFYPDLKVVIPSVLLWQIILICIGYLGLNWLVFKESFPYVPQILKSSGLPQFIWQWANFDGVHYIDIVHRGYEADGVQVFFPLYPLVIRSVNLLINNYVLSGIVVSHLLFLLACLFFHHLVRLKFSSQIAFRSLIFLLSFPTSFFFGSVYTESLFFLLIVLSFSTSGWIAGVLGALSGATRLVGIAAGLRIFDKEVRWKALTAATGLLSYILYLGIVYHRPLAFLESQSAFKNARAATLSQLVNPLQVLWRYLKIFTTASPSHYDYWLALLEVISFIAPLLFLLYLTWRQKLPRSYLLFSYVCLLLPTISGTFSSMPRYILTIFPLFIGLGQIKNRAVTLAVILVFVLLFPYLALLFTHGYFIG